MTCHHDIHCDSAGDATGDGDADSMADVDADGDEETDLEDEETECKPMQPISLRLEDTRAKASCFLEYWRMPMKSPMSTLLDHNPKTHTLW